jgi:hypothetical protein
MTNDRHVILTSSSKSDAISLIGRLTDAGIVSTMMQSVDDKWHVEIDRADYELAELVAAAWAKMRNDRVRSAA